jgi:hypothetical protein
LWLLCCFAVRIIYQAQICFLQPIVRALNILAETELSATIVNSLKEQATNDDHDG